MSDTHAPRAGASLIVVEMDAIADFIVSIAADAERIRHQEVCWCTQTVSTNGDRLVCDHYVIAGYILEHDHGPRLVQVHHPCGLAPAAKAAVSGVLDTLRSATDAASLRLRGGRLSLEPSPLLPTTNDVLRALCPGITTPDGTSYLPWSDGWAVGFECHRRDGRLSFLYLNPSGEVDEGGDSVFVYLGGKGHPAHDLPQHWYDPFGDPTQPDWFTVRTANADRQWQADCADHARRKHEEAFSDQEGEAVLAVVRAFPGSRLSAA